MSNNTIVRSASFEASGQEAPQCYCQLDAVWRKVAKEGNNHGRHFWGCSRFGHKRKCRFFQWVDEDLSITNPQSNGNLGKIMPTGADRYDHPVSSPDTPPRNVDACRNENEIGNENKDENRRNSPVSPSSNKNPSHSVQLQSEDSFTTVMGDEESPLFSLENVKTPLDSPCSDPTMRDTSPKPKSRSYKYYKPRETQNSLNIKRRRDALETPPDNGIPRFTTPELLEIIENHMNQQDRFGYRQELSKELAREENRKLKSQMDHFTKDMEHMNREIQLLKHEKRVLELDLDVAQQELRDIKRRRRD